jgi:hypothetical protein
MFPMMNAPLATSNPAQRYMRPRTAPLTNVGSRLLNRFASAKRTWKLRRNIEP